jgi:hypothetical protein
VSDRRSNIISRPFWLAVEPLASRFAAAVLLAPRAKPALSDVLCQANFGPFGCSPILTEHVNEVGQTEFTIRFVGDQILEKKINKTNSLRKVSAWPPYRTLWITIIGEGPRPADGRTEGRAGARSSEREAGSSNAGRARSLTTRFGRWTSAKVHRKPVIHFTGDLSKIAYSCRATSCPGT